MPTCKHCGEPIRWVETMGWIHDILGSTIRVSCSGGNVAEVTDEWLATLRFIE